MERLWLLSGYPGISGSEGKPLGNAKGKKLPNRRRRGESLKGAFSESRKGSGQCSRDWKEETQREIGSSSLGYIRENSRNEEGESLINESKGLKN